MELPQDENIKRKDPYPKPDGELITKYIKINDISMEKLTADSFDIPEILDFYDNHKNKPTTLPIQPQTARDVNELFKIVESKRSTNNTIWYGIMRVRDKSQYIGDIKVGPINWNDKEATIEFFIPRSEDVISDILVSVCLVLIKDLGIKLVRIRTQKDDADLINKLAEQMNGFYEGVRRNIDEQNNTNIMHEWSITRSEILDEDYSETQVLNYINEET
jgi:hypothetical protein